MKGAETKFQAGKLKSSLRTKWLLTWILRSKYIWFGTFVFCSFCSSDFICQGFGDNMEKICLNFRGRSYFSYLCPWMDCCGRMNQGVCVVIVTKNIFGSLQFWNLLFCDKLTWFKSRTLSRNNNGKLLPLTYKPPCLFTPRLTTGNMISSLPNNRPISFFTQANAKVLLQAIQIHCFLTNHFQKTFEGLLLRCETIQTLHQALWWYIYELQSCVAFVF